MTIEQDKKREIWESIKKVDPDTAIFIREMADAFGRLDNLEIIELGQNHDTESDTTSD